MDKQSEMDLQSRLHKAVVGCGLRDILTQHGIPQDEVVKISIENSQGKVLVSTDVPTSKGKVMTNQTSNLREDVVEFLNRADTMFELVSKLPKSDVSLSSQKDGVEQTEEMYKITFECGKIKSVMMDSDRLPPEMKESPLANISILGFRCKPCPPAPCCYK